MYNSTLTRKTPLKAKKSLRQCSIDKHKGTSPPSKAAAYRKRTSKPYIPAYKYESIFTSDLKRCFISGCKTGWHNGTYHYVHVHHIFGGANKKNSEKYHFLIPLRDDWHDLSEYGVHRNKELDFIFKVACQEYFLRHYGAMDDFISIFGKCWVPTGDVRTISDVYNDVVSANRAAA